MPLCPECGALFTEKSEGDWYDILATLSDQVPSREHCDDWLTGKGILHDQAEQVATAMLASLRYDVKKQAWMYNGKPRYQIWRIFQSWCLRDLRQNGARPGGMQVKKGTYY